MQVARTGPDAVTVEFESADELRKEHRANLSVGGLLLMTDEPFALQSRLTVVLRGAWGGEVVVPASVVALMPGSVALAIEGNGDAIFEALLPASAREPDAVETEPEAGEDEEEAATKKGQTLLDRIRAMSRVDKILFASKADRTARAFLLLDNDPGVLSSLLRNPRITMEEVVRVAKSSFLSFQIVELIMQTGGWMGNPDVRVALVQNPKTPTPFALRILPTLPEQEIKNIARGSATSMALKQAALKRMQGGK